MNRRALLGAVAGALAARPSPDRPPPALEFTALPGSFPDGCPLLDWDVEESDFVRMTGLDPHDERRRLDEDEEVDGVLYCFTDCGAFDVPMPSGDGPYRVRFEVREDPATKVYTCTITATPLGGHA